MIALLCWLPEFRESPQVASTAPGHFSVNKGSSYQSNRKCDEHCRPSAPRMQAAAIDYASRVTPLVDYVSPPFSSLSIGDLQSMIYALSELALPKQLRLEAKSAGQPGSRCVLC
jgi:hypothetical protein